jgi:septal ring factor EnvC (AmiA/AmiB activator)
MGAYASMVKIIVIAIVILVGGYALNSLMDLKADLAISAENAKKLEKGIEDQKATIKQLQDDQKKILDINATLNTQIQLQNKDLANLQDRFKQDSKGNARNFGDLAAKNPGKIEQSVNRGTANATRCLEIASGSPLTDKELKATQRSEINTECPSIANPNYVAK